MFSLLNSESAKGKIPARMCKILDSLSQFFHGVWPRFSCAFYPIEDERIRSKHSVAVGLSIALLVRQPALLRIRSRKD
jgi:hypothetical protein